MMKKFFSKYFLIVAMVAAVGCISSCKDYNDEMNAKIDGVDATLQKLIEKHQDAVKDSLENARKERDELKKSLEKKISDLENLYVKKSELEKLKEELGCTCTGESGCTCTGNSCTCTGGTTSCACPKDQIDKNKQDIEDLLAKVNDESLGLAALNTRIENLDTRVREIEGLKDRVVKLEEELLGKNFVTQEQLEELKKIVEGINSCTCDFNGLKTQVDQNTSDLTDLQEKYNKNKEEVQKTLDDNKTSIEAAQKVQEEYKHITDSIIRVVRETEIVHVRDSASAWVDDLALDLEAKYNETAAELETIETNLENLYNKVEDYLVIAKTYTDDAIDQLKDYVVPAIGGLEALLNEVRIDLDDLENEVTELSKEVATNMAAINSLMNTVFDMEDQRILSVNIQGAYSPVIGYFNMPMGIKSNIVAAYYGEFATGETEINFPFVYSSSMLNGEMNDLNDLKASLGYNGETVDALCDSMAGKIYLTINPAEVTLENVEFALVNSLGEKAPVELTVAPSKDKLSFGYTRAGGVALYEANAKITDFEATDFDLNVADYKEVFRDLKDGGDVNLSLIAEALYGTFNEIADANAVSAVWTDAMAHKHTVLSNYDIAALSVQPLSFAFMKDVTVETVPGINKISQVIDNIMNRINVDISIGKIEDIDVRVERIDIDEDKFVIDLSDIEIDGVKAEITKDALTGKLYVEVDGNKEYIEVDESIEVSINEQHLTLTYNYDAMIDEIKKIEDYDNEQVGEIEKVISQANAALAQIRETEDKINNSIKDAKDNVASLLNGYLNKLNGYLSGVINSVNAKLQPVLLVCADKDFALLSQSETRPVEVANELTLVPTTYSAELLAPAYKKYVAITAVNGSTDNLAAINAAAGEDLNKVLDGDVREITFKGESGNTYEITYSALDYAGFVVNTKYYVTVK